MCIRDRNIPRVKSSTTSVSNLLDYLKKYVSCGTYYNKYEMCIRDRACLMLKLAEASTVFSRNSTLSLSILFI